MLPASIHRKITALRFWEAFLRVLWGAARWLLLVIAFLMMACLIDWAIDRYYQTPWSVRLLLFTGQAGVALAAVVFLLIRPLVGRLSDSDMALLVEEKTPTLKNRLISIVQFHQPGANLQGMSPELVAKVTEETQQQTASMSFARVADQRRLGWSLAVAVPAVLLLVGPLLAWPEMMQALLSRQMLLNVEIPRSIYLDSINKKVMPRGEEIVLRFLVQGKGVAELTRESRGLVRIDPEGMPAEYFILKPESDPKGKETVFAATLPPGYGDLDYRAWLLDGRSDEAAHLKIVPRPVVQEIKAWVQLPAYCGLTPSGRRYELEQPRGETVAIMNSALKVQISIQKPVKKATLQMLGWTPPLENPQSIGSMVGLSAPNFAGGLSLLLPALGQNAIDVGRTSSSPSYFESVLKDIPMQLGKIKRRAETVVSLPISATGYRLIVEDEYGFRNIPAPRRSIRIVPEDAPRVALLPEQFPPESPLERLRALDDFYVDGAPVPAGSRFRIAYTCSGPFGLGMAKLHYRIFKKGEEGSMSSSDYVEPKWITIPLKEKTGSREAGAFDLRLGAFANSPPSEQIEFHAIPSDKPEEKLGRTLGGGRFDIEVKNLLVDETGKYYDPQPGDQIEYFIEVFADKDEFAGRPTARSETRLKAVVTPAQAVQWVAQVLQEESRIRQLEKKQKTVFSSN